LPSSQYAFLDPRGGPPREITVFLHRPETFRSANPVLVAMHGRGRNGADYRDFFVEESERHGFLVVVPEFSEAHYAHPLEYNYGAMWNADGSFRPREAWLFPVIEAVFRDASARAGATSGRFFLAGHSAGGQVVHRLATYGWSPLLEAAVAANAGSYMLPTAAEPFPFGLGGAPPADLPALFARRLVILLGDADNDPGHEQLPREPGAMRQGPHRFARGHAYFERGRAEAERLGVPFHWRLAVAPGVAHSGKDIAPFAVRELLGV
jgi:poly(3-hydroxybutyrate) depolymerase